VPAPRTLEPYLAAAWNTGLGAVESNLRIYGGLGGIGSHYAGVVATWSPFANLALCHYAGPRSRYCGQDGGMS
jgi:hypothetical protein